MNNELNRFKEIEKFIALLSITIAILITIPYVVNLSMESETCITSSANTATGMFYTTLILCLIVFLLVFFKCSVSQLIKVLFNDKQVKV
jgi:uncharacterized membrane protein YesL